MKKVNNFIQKYMFMIIIAGVGISYILTGSSNIIKTGETLESIIASSVLGTILGWLISSLFGKQAIQDAYNDPDFINAINSLGEEIEKVDDESYKLDIYCDKENEATMIRKRTRILKRANIKYKHYENNGYPYKLSKRQKKAIKKADKIGYGYLSSDWLLSDIEEKEEKDNKPINLTKYQFKKDATNLFTKTIIGLISGLYILEPFTNMNWNIIIWRVFFFALWLIFGYFRYVGDFNFTSKEYRKQVISKTNHIIKFRNSLNNHPDWYQENKQIEAKAAPLETEVRATTEEKLINTELEKEETTEQTNMDYKNKPLEQL